jgi:hypothetical protein
MCCTNCPTRDTSISPMKILIEKCNDILDVNRDVIVSAMAALSVSRKIVIEDLHESLQETGTIIRRSTWPSITCVKPDSGKAETATHAPGANAPIDRKKPLHGYSRKYPLTWPQARPKP